MEGYWELMAILDGSSAAFGGLQVSREHYFTREYLAEARFLGLHAQLHACLEACESRTILEVGPGPGLLAALLRHLGRSVLTLDPARELGPDVVGSLPQLPFQDDSFDLVCAFEVLEHMPLELLGVNLGEMGRVAVRNVIITVPDQREIHRGKLGLRISVGQKAYSKTLWQRPLGSLTNPREHYWEIGLEGVSAETVKDQAQRQGLKSISNYFVRPWFHVFVFGAEC